LPDTLVDGSKGVALFEKMLQKADELAINVRGKIIMSFWI
jgi:hypothetical protein